LVKTKRIIEKHTDMIPKSFFEILYLYEVEHKKAHTKILSLCRPLKAYRPPR
jgi:hypothetical protein